MAIATYDAINLMPSAPVPPKLRIGYDTQTGEIYVTRDGGDIVAYLPPRESLELAQNVLGLHSGKESKL